MQVQENIKRCVGFMYCMLPSGLRAVGTAFFVGVPIEGFTDKIATYAISARHVIESIKKRGIDRRSYFRFNKRGGGAGEVQLPLNEWKFDDDARIDVAIAPIKMDFDQFDHLVLPHELFLNDDRIREHAIGPGDELFFPGLFVHHQGKDSAIPILRVGNIAAMPGERIETTDFGNIRGYLVEARSLGGLSGSPVFVHIGPGRKRNGKYQLGGMTFYLLGLVHGHYDIADVLDSVDAQPSQDSAWGRVNSGIAIVVPVDDIDRVLSHPDFVRGRERAKEHLLREAAKSTPSTE